MVIRYRLTCHGVSSQKQKYEVMCMSVCAFLWVYTLEPKLLILVLMYIILQDSYPCSLVCVWVCCHSVSSICWRRLVTDLVSPAPVEARHTHTHTALYGNVNSVSPENALFDLTAYSASLLLLHLLLLFLLSFYCFPCSSSSVLHSMKTLSHLREPSPLEVSPLLSSLFR